MHAEYSRGAVELASWGGDVRQRGASLLAPGKPSAEILKLGTDIAKGKITALFSQGLEEGECNSWRGCGPTVRKDVDMPAEVKFECGGDDAADTCVAAVQKCTEEAEADASALFAKQPTLATELRAQHNCKCFVSNGCKPSCNVAMYMVWSAQNGMRCRSEPPVYLEASGAYQYGDPYTNRVLPSDLSYDYFPDFPNPAGHIMNVPAVRHRYAQDPKTDFECVPFPFTMSTPGTLR